MRDTYPIKESMSTEAIEEVNKIRQLLIAKRLKNADAMRAVANKH